MAREQPIAVRRLHVNRESLRFPAVIQEVCVIILYETETEREREELRACVSI